MIPVVRLGCFNYVIVETVYGSAPFLIDSGAAFTYVTVQTISALTGYSVDELSVFFNKHSNTKLETAAGDVSTSHAYLRNVRVGDVVLKEFHLRISTSDKKMSLLGMDFINACRLTVDYGEATLDGFDPSKYLHQLSRYKDEAYEILHMSSPAEVVFDEYCTKFSITGEARDEELGRLLSMFGVTTLEECSEDIKNTFL